MSEPFLGEMRTVPYNFPPRGWAFCEGQLLPIAQNTALFSLLGTQYGGDGITTFALPDLRGRVARGASATRPQGQAGGEATVVLSIAQIPAHTHSAFGAFGKGTQTAPTNAVWAEDSGGAFLFAATATVAMAPSAIGNTGGSGPHGNMQPTLALSWIISLQGLFPSRN